jgi:hypothetical protein
MDPALNCATLACAARPRPHHSAAPASSFASTSLSSSKQQVYATESTCCNNMFQVFQIFHRYVVSVVYRCCKSRSRCYTCCNDYKRMFQVYVSKCLICFRRMLQVFYLDVTYTCMLQAYVSSVFRCFIRMFVSVSSKCCICLQLFSNVFQVFSQVFQTLVFKCFIYLFFCMCTTVVSVCFKNR